MKIIKLNFVDFWPGFERTDNYIYNLLSKHYRLTISEEPQFLFYSCYGNEYLRYDCVRVFYSAENIRPDYTGCDFSMSFDFIDNPSHFRLPLYVFYIDQRKKWDELLSRKTRDEALAAWREKRKFCCMVVSNGLAKKRINFFNALSKFKHVDSGGRYLNNVGGPVKNKLAFIKEYKFVIAFENSSYPGYTTEKLLDPLLVGSIPVYWGNPLVEMDFNTKRFLNYNDYSSEKALIDRILSIDDREEHAISILTEPIFPDNTLPEFIKETNVLGFLQNIIGNLDTLIPAAKRPVRYRHAYRRKMRVIRFYLNKVLKRNFR